MNAIMCSVRGLTLGAVEEECFFRSSGLYLFGIYCAKVKNTLLDILT
jgi:hypothetical protein